MLGYLDYLYVLLPDGAEWEDIVLFTSKEEAIQMSKKHPELRVEIFCIAQHGGYRPTYTYYRNGEFHGQ